MVLEPLQMAENKWAAQGVFHPTYRTYFTHVITGNFGPTLQP